MGKGFGQHRNIAADGERISDINCLQNKNNLIKTEKTVIFMKKYFMNMTALLFEKRKI